MVVIFFLTPFKYNYNQRNHVNTKAISIIGAIIAVILVVYLIPINPEVDTPSEVNDEPEVQEEVSVEIEVDTPSEVNDEPEVQEEVSVEIEIVEESIPEDIVILKNEDGVAYYLDENGTKHYVIDIIDNPEFG